MSEPTSRAPGYYPDPASNNQIRYWNGSGWAEQHQSATYGQPTTGTGAPTTAYGVAPAPYGDQTSPYGAAPTSYGTPPAPYVSPASGYGSTATGYGSTATGYGSAATGYGTPPTGYGTPPGPTPSPVPPSPYRGPGYQQPPRRSRSGVGVVAGLVVVLAIGAAVWGFVSNVAGPPEPSGEVQVDSPLQGDVPRSDAWASSLTITDAGVYWLTATADEDLTMEVFDSDDGIAENDDGGNGFPGTGALDPVLALYLEPGEYVVAVETYDDVSADAELRVTAVTDAVEVGAAQPVPITTSGEQPWFGYTTPSSGSIAIDVRAADESDDLVLTAWFDGEDERSDERDPGDPPAGRYDPYLEIPQPDGRVVLVVSPWGSSGEPIEGTVTVTST